MEKTVQLVLKSEHCEEMIEVPKELWEKFEQRARELKVTPEELFPMVLERFIKDQPKYQMEQRVKVVRHLTQPRYIGLVGVIVWIGENWKPRPLYQIKTETKPPYYHPAHPEYGYIITVGEDDIELCV